MRHRVDVALWIRGLIFTLLVPYVVGIVGPSLIESGSRAGAEWHEAGWVLVGAGATIYAICLWRFLAVGGTPSIFFTRPLRFVLGEEPSTLVEHGVYRVSRNPMYVGVLLVVFGQAVARASLRIAAYGGVLGVIFHLVVVFVEEPHLRDARGAAYDAYCRRVPRWLGRPRPGTDGPWT